MYLSLICQKERNKYKKITLKPEIFNYNQSEIDAQKQKNGGKNKN